MSVTYTVTITRNTNDHYTTSYDVWAKRASVPEAVGDGAFVGNYPILANEASIDVTYATPLDGQYYFLCIPRRDYLIGRETLL